MIMKAKMDKIPEPVEEIGRTPEYRVKLKKTGQMLPRH